MHPEFIGQTPPPGGAPLRLETRTEAFVRAASRTGPRSSSPATPASPGSAWRGELRGTQGYAVSNTAASGWIPHPASGAGGVGAIAI